MRTVTLLILLPLLGASPEAPPLPKRPVATYSIVARDPETGQMGVAVQSHWFSVGPIVPWAEAGVGAVATQSLVDPAYGPRGLDLMRAGRSAPEALAILAFADKGRAVRQVAMIDAQGRVAVHTGVRAIAAAGHKKGEEYSVQANLMEKPSVWPAMAKAYEEAEGDLAERLLRALEAAEAEGGDIRGRQSAAILIVSSKGTGKPWVDRLFDLRVEDHPRPVAELRRLVQLQRAYRRLNEGDEWVAKKEMAKAMAAYKEATTIVPDEATNGEAAFWVGVTLVNEEEEEEAIPYLRRAYGQDPSWARLVPRLPASGLLPDDQPLMDRLVMAMKQGVSSDPGPNRIINLYDAFGPGADGTTFDFGFSCLIVHEGKTILFDAGTNADILEANAKALGADLGAVDFAVGSHAHPDHLDGFDYLLAVNPSVKIYLPGDFYCGAPLPYSVEGPSPGAGEALPRDQRYFQGGDTGITLRPKGRFGGADVEYVRENREIAPGVTLIVTESRTLGYFSRYPPHEDSPRLVGMPEVSLSLSTKEGEVLVVGCSHSSVEEIVKQSKEHLDREIDLVFGGYHMLPYDEQTIAGVAARMRDEYGVKRAAPAHCTGHLGFKVFRETFGDGYESAGLGAAIPISE